jgi:hypothetical protein
MTECNKCRKSFETITNIAYNLEIIPLKNSADGIFEIFRSDEEEKKLRTEKFFCLDCWKKVEENYRKLSGDTLNWRWEWGRGKKMNEVLFIRKIFRYPEDDDYDWKYLAYNQLKKQWMFGKGLDISTENPKFDEEADEDVIITNDSSGISNKPFNEDRSFNYFRAAIILVVIGLVVAALSYFFPKKKKKQ